MVIWLPTMSILRFTPSAVSGTLASWILNEGLVGARGFVDFVGVAPRVPVSLARVVGDGSRGEPTLRSS